MGVNLVTRVRNFSIDQQTFLPSDHDVQDGCVTPGTHRLLRFDFLSYNAGTSDLVIGSPAARPDLFIWSPAHGHYHLICYRTENPFAICSAVGGSRGRRKLTGTRNLSRSAYCIARSPI